MQSLLFVFYFFLMINKSIGFGDLTINETAMLSVWI
ncbi:hypothetical protein PPIS_a6003 [Pseudoalteromonas piscicida]|uniref:Potassium channel domain-containing protein n=1 Tax=Pseudoalteromonas piscicida TaxID=43662 RepID=A0ABM6NI12_PSEO7|nr:hypothetical protein PPIS_a6003 [Pseudoalteromonas piscicida]